MGFFKKIGKAVKKTVSFKNLVKIATPVMGAIPFVGGTLQNVSEGLQASHEAKKQAQRDNDAQAYAQAQQQEQQVLSYAGKSVGAIAGAGTQTFVQGLTEGIYNGASNGVKQGLGTVASEVADSALSAWFKKHWKHLLIALGVIGGFLFIRNSSGNNSRKTRRR
ncbi:MAG: hypothetical protein REI96_18605 [Flavobacterium nitrogenifigens]|uniref:hypothetical protein n=2 Tax=Flavobacterium nitrogenifigens TaxID=1617283 RepID=UPI002809F6D8|nr:hypothetical protein [Flavobacterium nitrogenifigens]MDQ8014466.1 hypothetical protein [Flavobacterium nitrogenifigens]